MKKITHIATASLALLSLLLLGQIAPVWAAVGIDPNLRPDYAAQGRTELADPNADPEDKYGTTAVNLFIGDVAVVLIQMAGVVAIYFIVSNALTYVKSFGRDEELQKAKKGLIWAIVGLIIIIVSYAIVQNVLKITLSVDESAVSGTSILNAETTPPPF